MGHLLPIKVNQGLPIQDFHCVDHGYTSLRKDPYRGCLNQQVPCPSLPTSNKKDVLTMAQVKSAVQRGLTKSLKGIVLLSTLAPTWGEVLCREGSHNMFFRILGMVVTPFCTG